MPTRADRKCASACCFNSGPLPLAQRHVRIIVHRVPAMQYVLENAGPDVEAHAPHHRFIGPKNATEHAVAPGHLKLWERGEPRQFAPCWNATPCKFRTSWRTRNMISRRRRN